MPLARDQPLPRHLPGVQARQAFGRWLNCVRNAQRMLLSWADPSEAPVVHEFARWNAALATSACAYLRRKDCYWQHMEGLLQPAELAWLMRCDNAPVKVLMIMSGLLKRWARVATAARCAGDMPAAVVGVHAGVSHGRIRPASQPASRPAVVLKPLPCARAGRPRWPPVDAWRRTGLLVWERAEIERQLSDFDIALGALERISRQAVPKAYTRCAWRVLPPRLAQAKLPLCCAFLPC